MLARLLLPSDFGIAALLGAFIGFSNVLVNGGLGSALIQAKKINNIDCSTVLYTTIFISLLLMVLLFFSANSIAKFYNNLLIENLLKIYSISLFFSAITGIQNSILVRNLSFKKIFYVNALSVLISGSISINMAFIGFGIYAIVANALISGFLNIIFFFLADRWVPILNFSFTRLKALWSYGYKLMLFNFIEALHVNIYPILIGKNFSASSLGFYNNGRQFPSLITSSINAALTSVSFSVFSKYQSNQEKLKNTLRESLRISNFLILPIITILAISAEPIVIGLLGQKWSESVPYLQLFCLVFGLHHHQSLSYSAIAGLGRSDIVLFYQTFIKLISIILLIYSLKFGLVYVVIGQIFSTLISLVITIIPNRRYLDYRVSEQVLDLLPYLVICVIIFAPLHIFFFNPDENIVLISMKVIAFIGAYFVISKICNLKGANSFFSLIKKHTNKNNSAI